MLNEPSHKDPVSSSGLKVTLGRKYTVLELICQQAGINQCNPLDASFFYWNPLFPSEKGL